MADWKEENLGSGEYVYGRELEGISESFCCSNKLPQTCWLKTTQNLFLQFWRLKSEITLKRLKSKCQEGCVPSGGSTGGSVPLPFSSFSMPTAFLGSWCLPPSSEHITATAALSSHLLTLILLSPSDKTLGLY